MGATLLRSQSIASRSAASNQRGTRVLTSSRFVLAICVLAGCSATAQNGPKMSIILPGQSVAGVKLGDDAARFEQVFPKRSASDDHSSSGSVGQGCPTEIYYWSDLAADTSVVTAYLSDGTISQISVQGPMFSLPDGLKTGTTEEQVKQAYPKAQGYVLAGSASHLNGGRNLLYWVDKGAGVAFKLAWWPSKGKRLSAESTCSPRGPTSDPRGAFPRRNRGSN